MRLFLHCVLLCQCVHDLVIHHLVGVIAVVGKDGDTAVRESISVRSSSSAALREQMVTFIDKMRENDTDTDVVISAKALRHGLDRRFSVNAPAMLKAGEILQNAVRINELVPKLDTVDATYVLMGVAKNKNNEPYIVQFVVNRASNEVMSVDVLYAINAKKEPAASLPKFTDESAPLTGSTISIADLLTYVNRYFPDVLPEGVLRHFGHSERPAGKLGEGAMAVTGAELCERLFQSTPPLRGGATNGRRQLAGCIGISIHAPREGGDCTLRTSAGDTWSFQSTPPARGATLYAKDQAAA